MVAMAFEFVDVVEESDPEASLSVPETA